MGKRVVVLGAGVGGLTVAHELAERGFQVTVYEQMWVPGGKARSLVDPNTGQNGRHDLPGEHGFRFFPTFYRHVIDTMWRIPCEANRKVGHHLVSATNALLARAGQAPLKCCAGCPKSVAQLKLFVTNFIACYGVPWREFLHFIRCVLVMMTSCKDRFDEEYEWIPYWRFIGADQRSCNPRLSLGKGSLSPL